ncbi:MAG: DUF3800 domain-containing protein [Pseudomonadota bacterium]
MVSRNLYVVYADESGDHSLTKVDEQFPVFSLSLCIFEQETYIRSIVPRFQRIKFEHYNHDNIIFHERDIRKQSGCFANLIDRSKRVILIDQITHAIRKSRFRIAAAVIDKRRVRSDFFPENPYSIALRACLERTYLYLESRNALENPVHFVFEKRGKKEDQELELEFYRVIGGNNSQSVKLTQFEISFADKKSNTTGMQIADMTARPIALRVLRPYQENRAFKAIHSKLVRGTRGSGVSGPIYIFK